MKPCFRHVLSILLSLGSAFMAGDSVAQTSSREKNPEIRLGFRLFIENRISNPGSNFTASCRSCHLPPWAPEGKRAYADMRDLSLMPSTARGKKLTTIYNTPSLLDVASMTRFNHDGAFDSIEAVITAKLLSPHLGWLPEDKERALDEIYALILNDMGEDEIAEGTYIEQFQAVYGVNLEGLEKEGVVDFVVRSLATFLRSLQSPRTSPYDAFLSQNGLSPEPAADETVSEYARRFLAKTKDRAKSGRLVFPESFGPQAYAGLKTFFQTDGDTGAGNCVTCHVPPLFTDSALHIVGTAASDLNTPFKTPPLRNLGYTGPYMHDGTNETIEDALRRKIEARDSAGDASPPHDAPLAAMRIAWHDVPALTAFLRALNDPQSDLP